jgi:hypothetical protein
VLLGIFQAIAHMTVMPMMARARYPYSPGALTAALLHVPIGITYIRALRAQGRIERSDWVKSAAVLGAFFVFGVAVPNVALRNKNSPYEFTDRQMGPYKPESEVDDASTPAAND